VCFHEKQLLVCSVKKKRKMASSVLVQHEDRTETSVVRFGLEPAGQAAVLFEEVSHYFALPCASFSLVTQGGLRVDPTDYLGDDEFTDRVLQVTFHVHGGIDFQHREGSKIGGGGNLSESQAAIERRERLRKLALETIDISKDPYFMRNHLGSYECKLCLTLHTNEGNYLAHTQGKRHQSNLGRRAAMEAKNAAPRAMVGREQVKRRVIRIGRPGYKVRSCSIDSCRLFLGSSVSCPP